MSTESGELQIVHVRVTEALGGSGEVTPVPWQAGSSSWDAAMERKEVEPAFDPRVAVAAEVGAGIMVGGSLYSQSGNLRFEAEITGEGGHRWIGSIDPVVFSLDSVVAGIEILSGRVAAAVAFHLNPIWTGTTYFLSPMPTIAVLEDYVRAYEVGGQGDWEQARALVERALRQDSDYVPAKLLLAIAHLNLGDYLKADSLAHELEGAYDRMPLFERISWRWLRATLDGNREAAFSAAREYMEETPSRGGKYTYGFEALRVNRPEEALEVLWSLNQDAFWTGLYPGYWVRLCAALHMLGEHVRELDQAKRGRKQHPEDFGVFAAELRALAALDRIQDVNELLDEAVDRGIQPAELFLLGAAELRAHDHRTESLAVARRALDYLRQQPASVADTEDHRYDLLRVFYVLERWDEAQPIADDLARRDPSDPDFLGYLGTLAARRGDSLKARRVSQELADLEDPYLRGYNVYWQASIAALLGKKEPAVLLLRQAHEKGRNLDISIHTDMNLEPLRGDPAFEAFMRPKGG